LPFVSGQFHCPPLGTDWKRQTSISNSCSIRQSFSGYHCESGILVSLFVGNPVSWCTTNSPQDIWNYVKFLNQNRKSSSLYRYIYRDDCRKQNYILSCSAIWYFLLSLYLCFYFSDYSEIKRSFLPSCVRCKERHLWNTIVTAFKDDITKSVKKVSKEKCNIFSGRGKGCANVIRSSYQWSMNIYLVICHVD